MGRVLCGSFFALLIVTCLSPLAAGERAATVSAGSIPADDYSSSLPLIAPTLDGTGVQLMDRSFMGGFIGPDTAYDAMVRAMERNPGLLRQYATALYQRFGTHPSGVLTYEKKSDIARQFAESGLREYIRYIQRNPDLETMDLEAFTADWYDEGAVPVLATIYKKVSCGYCGSDDTPSVICAGQCVRDCVDTGTTCHYESSKKLIAEPSTFLPVELAVRDDRVN